MNANNPSSIKLRRGSVLFAVLVCLLVVAMLAGALVQSILARQRQMRVEQQRSQAVWLAESAVERGAASLRKQAGYAGETWRATAEELGADKAGQAVIRVEAVEGMPQRRKLIVEAIYPDDPHRRIAVNKEILIDLPPSGESP